MRKKIQVMLVDDEYLAIEDLKTLVDWNSLGFEICATARSGKQALRAYEKIPADLIITDISMPGMDGIALIECLKQKNPSLRFLLLTAYAEIDYMKRAFKLGVEDYLIKDEISSSILCAKLSEIRTNHLSSQSQSYSFLQKNLRKYFSDSSCHFPESLFPVPSGNFLYCILAPDLIPVWREEFFIGSPKISVPKMIDFAMPFTEIFESPEIENFCSIGAYNNKILILLRAPEITSSSRLSEAVHRFSDSLIKELFSQYSISFSCFYSYAPMNLKKIHADFFSRQKAVRARYFLGSRQCEPLNSPRLFLSDEKFSLTENDLMLVFEQPDQNFPEFLSGKFDCILSSHNYYGLSHLLNLCFSFLQKQLEAPLLLYEKDLTDIFSLREAILSHAKEICESKNPRLPYEVRKAISYITEHFNEESLSIQDISEGVNLSPTHLSRIFKTATGDTLWDYLTKFRMQKACRILENSDIKIYEVAEYCGYSSPQYFSQVFYKQIGVKPLDYRKKEHL